MKLYTVGEAAEILAEPGLASKQARDRLELFARRDRSTPELFHSFGYRNEAGARVYPFSEVCKAKVLFALIDTGLQDRSALWATDQGLIGNQLDTSMSEAERTEIAALKTTPIERAIAAVEKGAWPTFVLTTYVHDQTGQRVRRGEIHDISDAPLPPPGGDEAYIPRSGVVIQLAPLLLPLLAKAGRTAKAN